MYILCESLYILNHGVYWCPPMICTVLKVIYSQRKGYQYKTILFLLNHQNRGGYSGLWEKGDLETDGERKKNGKEKDRQRDRERKMADSYITFPPSFSIPIPYDIKGIPSFIYIILGVSLPWILTVDLTLALRVEGQYSYIIHTCISPRWRQGPEF